LTSSVFLAISSALGLWDGADASAFLGSNPTVASESVSDEEVQTSLRDEIQAAVGSDAAAGRVSEMEEAIRAMYIALPKNEYGNLDHATVRYALHRLFVQRHGWFIKGLEAGGDHRNTSSGAGILKDRVPEYIHDLFEERMGGHGLKLNEVAVLASTIEHLVHGEAKGRLEAAFKAHSIPLTSLVSNDQAIDVLETYLMAFVRSYDLTSITWKEVVSLRNTITKAYPYWPETQKWVHQIHEETAGVNSSAMLDFGAVLRTVDTIGERFGRHQSVECGQLQADLLKFEGGNNGRVLISTFYQAALGGMWQFSESIDYLRQLGALDESTGQPSVIVPNYIGGVSNCLAASTYYKVCCPDQCDGLLGHIEAKIASSHAKPKLILDLVHGLSSATTSVPRDLPSALIDRLNEIAASNEGEVPIHGRLFAQWMHHAYPRECPYPHVSGTTNPVTSRDWTAETGVRATLTKGQMESHILAMEDKRAGDVVDLDLPWTDEEELLVIRPTLPRSSSSSVSWMVIRNVGLFVALGSCVRAMVQSTRATVHTLHGGRGEKIYV